jgi:uncharacterized protein DUF6965
MTTLTEIEKYFRDNGIPEGEIYLNAWTKIVNPKLFVEASISTLKANPRKKVYMPYFERLLDFYKIVRK